MNPDTRKKLARRKRRIQKRLRVRPFPPRPRPMFAARNIHYDISDRARAIAAYDAEAKRFMNWGDFVRSRPEASIRLFRLPTPR